MIQPYAIGLFVLGAMLTTQVGCVTYATKTVPANRLPLQMRGPCKDDLVPINFAALRQAKPKTYTLGPDDVLGIYVYGVLPPQREEDPAPPLVIHPDRFPTDVYYPPEGRSHAPTMGVPIPVESDGKIYLPLIEPIAVEGLSVQQLREMIAEAYSAEGFLAKGRELVFVNLIKPRVHRVVVIRGDAQAPVPTLINRTQLVSRERGDGALVDLPAFENDVLHALAATGGMPGTDAVNRIVILRGDDETLVDNALSQVETSQSPHEVLACFDQRFNRTSIPLRHCAGEPLPFGPDDIILRDGDVVFLEPRIDETYYTGGLLPAGEFPLPRDHDVDILEAMAMATGGVAAPAAGGNGIQNLIRQGAGPGNTLIPPTRAIVIRKLADGQQVRIRVDLRKALHDPAHRLIIQPEDFILAEFTPEQMLTNTMLNWFNWNLTLLPSGFTGN